MRTRYLKIPGKFATLRNWWVTFRVVFGNWSPNKVETRRKLVDTLSVAALSVSSSRERFHSFRENSGERNGSSDDGRR